MNIRANRGDKNNKVKNTTDFYNGQKGQKFKIGKNSKNGKKQF